MKKWIFVCLAVVSFSCNKDDNENPVTPPLEETVNENLESYKEISSLTLGGVGGAEITTYDPVTKRLFAVNNSTVNKIDVIDIANPVVISVIKSISMAPYGGYVNSVDVKNGKLAAAIESINKQETGKVVVFNTTTYAEEKVITVGALPDMVVYSPDGKYILTANEGEPSADYTNDPEGSVSIIDVSNGYSVRTLNFASFAGQLAALTNGGFRVFGPGKDIVKDVEPEYITVSEDSKTAWVTLQENNGIAELNLTSGVITKIIPLGFKDYSIAGNGIDPSDQDSKTEFAPWKVFGIYQPDGIASTKYNGVTYLFTANEGDAREYTPGYIEAKRGATLTLDPTIFPNAAALKTNSQLGRLNISTALGDVDTDGDYDALYSFGGRSFSIWNAATGAQVYDSKNELDIKAKENVLYDEARSDDKSVEPESVVIGRVGSKLVAYVGLERADAVAVYDITIPTSPVYIKMLKTGDAPEGVLFISATDSPIQQSLLVVSSENDGAIKIYRADKQ